MSKYLWTNDELRQSGILLGKMTERSYHYYLTAAKKQPGLARPAVGLTIEFKPGMGNDQPYPISEQEWPVFIADIPVYTRAEPEVYAFDSALYALPI